MNGPVLPEELNNQLNKCNGSECSCHAYGECECGCGVDWRSRDEVVVDYMCKHLETRYEVLDAYLAKSLQREGYRAGADCGWENVLCPKGCDTPTQWSNGCYLCEELHYELGKKLPCKRKGWQIWLAKLSD